MGQMAGCAQPAGVSELAVVGNDSEKIPLSEAPPGTVNILMVFASPAKGGVTTKYCGGSYIARGVVLTAAHCFVSESGVLRRVKVFIRHKPSHMVAHLADYDLVTHPHVDIALLKLDEKQQPWSSSPQRVALFELEENKQRHKSLYKGASFYGLGARDHDGDYGVIGASNDLFVLTQDGSLWTNLRYIFLSNFPATIKIDYLLRAGRFFGRCARPSSAQLFNEPYISQCRERLHPNDFLSNSHLIAGSYLYGEEGSAKNILFCPGDSGGGLRAANGRLLGVLAVLNVATTQGVRSEKGYEAFDQDALDYGCRSLGLFINLVGLKSWLESSLSSELG